MAETLGSCLSLKDQLTKTNEQILDLKEAAQRVKVSQEEMDDLLVPLSQKQTEMVKFPQQSSPERIVEQVVDVLVPNVMMESVEAVRWSHFRAQRGAGRRGVRVPVSS